METIYTVDTTISGDKEFLRFNDGRVEVGEMEQEGNCLSLSYDQARDLCLFILKPVIESLKIA